MYVVFLVGAVLAVWGILYWLGRKGAAEQRGILESRKRVLRTPLDDARLEARRILADDAAFVRVEAASAVAAPELKALPTELRELLDRFESIETKDGAARVSRSDLGASRHPGFVRVGAMLPGTDLECELAIKPREERLYEVETDAKTEAEGTYPSIHHWIISVSSERR